MSEKTKIYLLEEDPKMKGGLNLVLDEREALYPILLRPRRYREQATNGGYVHEGKLYLRKSYCNRCEDYDDFYKDRISELTSNGQWIISVAYGEANYKAGLIYTLLEEDCYMLLPVITESREEAIQVILEIIEDCCDVESGAEKVTLCEIREDAVFRIDQAGNDPIYIGARQFDEDDESLLEWITDAFTHGQMSVIELEDDCADPNPEDEFFCSECGCVTDQFFAHAFELFGCDDDDDDDEDDDNDCCGCFGCCEGCCCDPCDED